MTHLVSRRAVDVSTSKYRETPLNALQIPRSQLNASMLHSNRCSLLISFSIDFLERCFFPCHVKSRLDRLMKTEQFILGEVIGRRGEG